MAKINIKKLTNKGAAIKFLMERGMSNAAISKSLGIPESTVRYYRKRPDILKVKRASKLPKNILIKYMKWLPTKQPEKCLEDS